MTKEKKQSFVKGAAILSVGTFIVKILGLLFSIPLANIIDASAMSYFYVAYDVFTFFLLISTSGLPVSVSKMVGTAYSQGKRKEGNRVFTLALSCFSTIGAIMALVMFFFAEEFATLMGYSEAKYTVMALSPTVFFISIMSAVRGYFQGRSNMIPTATSQIIEATTKIIVGLGLAFLILSSGGTDESAAVGAIIGVSASAGFGTIYLILYKLWQNKQDKVLFKSLSEEKVDTKKLFKDLIKFSVPITLGACFLNILDIIDTAIIAERLSAVGYSIEESEWLRGVFGNARKFFDLPGAFVVPVSASLLPVLSAAVANKDKKQVKSITNTSIKLTYLVSVPASVAMVIFADPICKLLLFANPSAAEGTAPILSTMGVAVMFISALFTTNSIIQSLGHPIIPVINMSIGGFVKIALTYTLVVIPEINILGAAISTAVSYLLIMIINVIYIKKQIPEWEGFWNSAFRPIIASVIMGTVSYGAYYLLTLFLSPAVAILPTIPFAIVVYVIIGVMVKAVTYKDVIMMPKGDKLVRLLKLKDK